MVQDAGPWRIAQFIEDKVLITIGDGATFLVEKNRLQERATEGIISRFEEEDARRDGICHWAAAARTWLHNQAA